MANPLFNALGGGMPASILTGTDHTPAPWEE